MLASTKVAQFMSRLLHDCRGNCSLGPQRSSEQITSILHPYWHKASLPFAKHMIKLLVGKARSATRNHSNLGPSQQRFRRKNCSSCTKMLLERRDANLLAWCRKGGFRGSSQVTASMNFTNLKIRSGCNRGTQTCRYVYLQGGAWA